MVNGKSKHLSKDYPHLDNHARQTTHKNICDPNFVNCGSRNARCSSSKVEIISLAFNWLIVLRSAIKTCDQTHRVFKDIFAVS